MTDTRQFTSRFAAFEAGRKTGAREERERLAAEQEQHTEDDGPPALTMDAIRAGRFSIDELIERKAEVDALLAGEAR